MVKMISLKPEISVVAVSVSLKAKPLAAVQQQFIGGLLSCPVSCRRYTGLRTLVISTRRSDLIKQLTNEEQ